MSKEMKEMAYDMSSGEVLRRKLAYKAVTLIETQDAYIKSKTDITEYNGVLLKINLGEGAYFELACDGKHTKVEMKKEHLYSIFVMDNCGDHIECAYGVRKYENGLSIGHPHYGLEYEIVNRLKPHSSFETTLNSLYDELNGLNGKYINISYLEDGKTEATTIRIKADTVRISREDSGRISLSLSGFDMYGMPYRKTLHFGLTSKWFVWGFGSEFLFGYCHYFWKHTRKNIPV